MKKLPVSIILLLFIVFIDTKTANAQAKKADVENRVKELVSCQVEIVG